MCKGPISASYFEFGKFCLPILRNHLDYLVLLFTIGVTFCSSPSFSARHAPLPKPTSRLLALSPSASIVAKNFLWAVPEVPWAGALLCNLRAISYFPASTIGSDDESDAELDGHSIKRPSRRSPPSADEQQYWREREQERARDCKRRRRKRAVSCGGVSSRERKRRERE